MSKRTLLMVVALIAAVAIAATGTLAYLTDTDSDVNVMTLGNVDIEQIELQRTEDFIETDGHTGLLEEGDLEPFVDGKPLYPAYPVNNQGSDYTADPSDLLYWGPYVTAESDGTTDGAGNGLWNDDKLVGAVDKMVFVQNTGSSPAYYRTLIAFECPEGVEYSEGSDKQLMMNVNLNNRFQWKELGYVTLPDGQRYLVMCATYLNVLESGEISRPSLLQVVMTHNATNETVAAMGETYEILALSQAVQVENLDKLGAEKALDAAFGDANTENAAKWFGGIQIPTLVTDEETLKAALAEGGLVQLANDITVDETMLVAAGADVTIDLNGFTLTGTHTKADGAVLANEGTLTVKNGTIKSTAGNGGATIQNEGTLTGEGLTLNGAPNEGGGWPAYAVNNTGTATLTDCAVTSCHGGFSSAGAGAVLTLNDCTLDMSGIPGFTSHGFYTYSSGKIAINGGTYANNATDQSSTGASVINGAVEITDGSFTGRIENYYGKPVLMGGTYSVKPAAAYVAAGCTVTDNGNGTYTVK